MPRNKEFAGILDSHFSDSYYPPLPVLDTDQFLKQIEMSGVWKIPHTYRHSSGESARMWIKRMCEDWVKFAESALEGERIVTLFIEKRIITGGSGAVDDYGFFYKTASKDNRTDAERLNSLINTFRSLVNEDQSVSDEDKSYCINYVKSLASRLQ